MGFIENIGMGKQVDGRSKTIYYLFYKKMMLQCYSSKGRNFGITQVCDRWKYDFWKFVEDIEPLYIEQYKEDYCFGRKDHTKDFEIDNVFFGSLKKVMQKRKNCHKIIVDGVLKSVPEIHEILTSQGINIDEQSVRKRAVVKSNIGRPNERRAYEYSGNFYSLKKICEITGGKYPMTKYWIQHGLPLLDAVERSKTMYRNKSL